MNEGNATIFILVLSTLSTAIFHTLIPDHWLPFVFIGRARNWSVKRTVTISGFSALLHISLSLMLGLIGVAIGFGTSLAAGEALEKVSGILLILFGMFYAYWSFRKGGHFHIGGERIHHHHDENAGTHTHDDKQSDSSWDLDKDIITGDLRKSDWYLAFIIGLNPCIIIFPILFACASRGFLVITTVSILYALATLLMMIGMTVFGLMWAKAIRMKFFAKYGEILSGLLIACMGIVFLFLEL